MCGSGQPTQERHNYSRLQPAVASRAITYHYNPYMYVLYYVV